VVGDARKNAGVPVEQYLWSPGEKLAQHPVNIPAGGSPGEMVERTRPNAPCYCRHQLQLWLPEGFSVGVIITATGGTQGDSEPFLEGE
jgi:hypothetical protein